ncbi:YbdK family carboxylate-amine ligase [Streptomyces sp. WAC05374]|uniref:glutamate--cysteine ligase 2 n=1 Tax=Streptomyces sp. WAC05374 TaxID=2487420 RepID=UPI000F897440|nr:glutamate--cysteine ligase [Streptomyces sp. WAC05374]RST12424.1 YbdK family carboxylate-amine ligase [Streptomyces sp. WAC05374]TDF50350.1 YbdK family carboxylate-amine ligase [Streptomyces sp. WAC05374]TDF51715.1 YbdK family carboxylate-amine ligase [Streptomyces sp. WAC05374]TDF60603.1 YbdK family carboxylate-amine ligase [Streptomyces sp. WAC05374]
MRSVGVEEELLLVDGRSGEPRALSTAVLAAARDPHADEEVFESELQRQQLEFATSPQTVMGDLGEEIRRCRAEAARHAEGLNASVAALATSPLPVSPTIGTGERHQWLKEHFGLTAQEQLTCGCHVHVSVESDEEGVAVLDRIRPWLPVLLAMSGNSPFWQGEDSGYSSYRSRVWGRWPSAGPVEIFGSADRYHEQVADMVASGVLRDEGMVYFDARLSHTYPTVEVRVADVCLDPSTTVLVATLVRGLVETAARQWRDGEPPARHGVALLRLAAWRAARSGLEDQLVHPVTMRPAPAEAVVRALFDHVREALEDSGDVVPAQEALAGLLKTGNGASVQRDLLRRTGDLREVVAECARITTGYRTGC